MLSNFILHKSIRFIFSQYFLICGKSDISVPLISPHYIYPFHSHNVVHWSFFIHRNKENKFQKPSYLAQPQRNSEIQAATTQRGLRGAIHKGTPLSRPPIHGKTPGPSPT